jgi:hypothetical protein
MLLAAIEKKFPPAAHVRLLGNLSRVIETMTILCAARALRNVLGSRGLLNSHAAIETDPVMIAGGHVEANVMIDVGTIQASKFASRWRLAWFVFAKPPKGDNRGVVKRVQLRFFAVEIAFSLAESKAL